MKSALLFLSLLAASLATTAQIPYGSNHGKYTRVMGTRLYYEEYGRGIPLLLFPGAMGSISDFRKAIPLLATYYQVIAFDGPGQGRSDFPTATISYQLMADLFSLAMDNLKLDSAYVLGLGDGANAGLILAEERPEKVKKLVAVSAAYRLDGFLPGAIEARRHSGDTAWVAANRPDWIKSYVSKSPSGQWKKYILDAGQSWMAEVQVPRSVLEEIRIPVLLMYYDHDNYSATAQAELHDLVRGSQYAVLPVYPPETILEKPELLNLLIRDFFRGK